MTCSLCNREFSSDSLGTEHIMACKSCGFTSEKFIIEDIDLHPLHPECSIYTPTTPAQKISISKIDCIIEKYKFFGSKSKCHSLITEVFHYSKYRRLSRLNLAAACLVISARNDGFYISLRNIADEIGSVRSQIGRLIYRISKDFKLSHDYNHRKIQTRILSRLIDSMVDIDVFNYILQMSIDLFELSSTIMLFSSQLPFIYGSIYLSMFHFMNESSPNLETLCLHATVGTYAIQRSISIFIVQVTQLSSDIPFNLNKKNFVSRIPDILKYRGAILYNSNFHKKNNGTTDLLQHHHSHPTYKYMHVQDFSVSEPFTGITDIEESV